jgi:phthalate 4,5-dioxygenase reductase subunit
MIDYIDSNTNGKDSGASSSMSLTVLRKAQLARDITLFELGYPDQRALPPFSAGSHLAITTPNGLLRRYSLSNPPSERQRYVVAVQRDAAGGGGSVSMVDQASVGDQLQVSAPQNYFPLAPDGRRHLLIAGGIGITPIMSMIHELQARKAEFNLVYCTRFPDGTAFLDELSAPELAARVLLHHDHGDPARALSLGPIVAEPAEGTHLHCCGPRGLMQAVRALTAHWPAGTVHFEDFGTSAHAESGAETRFSVRLARSNTTIEVAPEVSILTALRSHGLPAPSSCEAGTCGSCRTGLLGGVADHRDFVLDEDEHDSAIMICVSRAQPGCEELVLDL